MYRIIGAALATLFCASSLVYGDEATGVRITRARAYFVGWDVMTRTRLSIDDVVGMKRIYFEINDPELAAHFADWLRLPEMRDRGSVEAEDARLVIELIQESGDVIVLYANKARLFAADSSRVREVDEDFRRRFDLARTRES